MGKRIFYHGTSLDSARSILHQGFKVGSKSNGRNLGAGLYLTTRPGFAAEWGDTIVRLCLRKGTRILWYTAADQATIRYLKREFGASITKSDFRKIIPRNKQLTRSEIVHLWNHLIDRHYLKSRRLDRGLFPRLVKNYPFIYKHLKRHGYDGVGILVGTWPEIFLFNPSNAIPLSAHSYTSFGWRSGWERNIKLDTALEISPSSKSSHT